MSRVLKFSAIALLALLMFAPMASAQRGRIIVRGGFGFYGPGFYGPYWGGYYGSPYRYYGSGPATGEIKIDTPAKDALVYVDGGYAGLSGKLRHFNLSPGAHDIELRDPSGKAFFQQHVQVLSGKTIAVGQQ
jgi:hypothetical protein